MGKRILRSVLKYRIPQYFIFASLLYIINRRIDSLITANQIEFFPEIAYTGSKIFLDLIFISIWITCYVLHLRSIHYSSKTEGRSLFKDSRAYDRSYKELVDHFTHADPHKLDLKNFPEETWRESSGIIFGKYGNKLIKLDSGAEGNILVLGSPGSRKTSGVAIPSAARFGGSVLAIDIKGDIYNYNKHHRDILRFCPDIPNALEESCHFNPFHNIHQMTETDRKIFIENMARLLIPDEGGTDGNYFSSRARKFFAGITHYLLYIKPSVTFPEIIHAILHPGMYKNLPKTPFEWVTTILESECMAAIEQVGSMYGNNEKNISGCWDAACSALIPYSNEVLDILLDGKGPCISIDALEHGYDCYLQISQEHLDAYAPLFTLIIDSMLTQFTKRPDTSTGHKNRPILVLLDECPQLSFRERDLNRALSTLRSKSINLMLIAQSKSQFEKKYGPNGTGSIFGNCSYQLILSCIDGASQRYFSNLIGSRKVLQTSNSFSTNSSGRNIQETTEPIFYPEDFGDLGDNLVIYYNGKYILAEKISCYAP